MKAAVMQPCDGLKQALEGGAVQPEAVAALMQEVWDWLQQ